jgi:cytochrome c
MRVIRLVVVILIGGGLAVAGRTAAAELPGKPSHGQTLFASKQCAHCHKPRGQQALGPSLEELRRRQGVLELTGRLWNHAPAMLGVLEYEGMKWPEINAAEMGDLMAYLQADHGLDQTPNLFAGQVTLVKVGCLKCHRLRGEGGSVAIELTEYHGGYDSPVVWAVSIWNHSPRMAKHAVGMGILYPRFTGEEMVNLYGYLRNVAGTPP